MKVEECMTALRSEGGNRLGQARRCHGAVACGRGHVDKIVDVGCPLLLLVAVVNQRRIIKYGEFSTPMELKTSTQGTVYAQPVVSRAEYRVQV